MQLMCDGRNMCIINKKAEFFREIYLIKNRIFLKNETGGILSGGGIDGDKIHACLHCELLRNITVILDDGEYKKVTIILDNTDVFRQVLDLFEAICPEEKFFAQNKKINGYSTALVEKLKEGIALTIVETKEQDNTIYCPVCGVQCEPGIPYCMECGASIE